MRILYNFYYGIFPGVIHTSDKYENLKRLKNLVLKITVVSPESSKDFLLALQFSSFFIIKKVAPLSKWIRNSHLKCSIKNTIYKFFVMFTGKHPFSIRRPATIKKRFQHRCFPLKLVKFLRRPIFKSIYEWLFLGKPFEIMEFIVSLEKVIERCSMKKVFLEISQNSQENTCRRGLQLY